MIQFINVTKRYPRTDEMALKDVNFRIDEGEFVFLIGPSGSGKTSIMRMLIREEKPSEGKIFFDEYDITKINRSKVYRLRRLVGVVFQDYKLIPHKNVYENVAFAMEVAGQGRHIIKETVVDMLDIVGLSHKMHSFPHQLSGGEQQRVAIARAIANNPRVLIADEPTGNLDPASAWDIVQILTKINSWGTTVLMSTHGTDIVNSLNKRVIQLHGGLIVRDDNKGQYELTKIDYGDKVLKANDLDNAPANNRSTLKVDLRTDKITKRLRDRKVTDSTPTSLTAEPPLEKIAVEEKLESVAEAEPEILAAVEPAPKSGGFHFPFINLLGRKEVKAAEQKKPEPESEVNAEIREVELTMDIDHELQAVSQKAVTTKIEQDAEKMPIDSLDLAAEIIAKLRQAGLKHVSDIIAAGPDQLADTKVIDPIEVIALSQAISEFVELEIEEVEVKAKAPKPAKKTKKTKPTKKSK